MKSRHLVAIVALLIVAVMAFAGCSPNALPTGKELRFSTESYTFNISLEQNGKENNQQIVKGESSETTYIGDYQLLPTSYDEIRPVDATGTYTIDINTDDTSKYTLTTKQVIYSVYDKSDYTTKLINGMTADQLATINTFTDEEKALTFTDKTLQQYLDEGKVVLRSTADTYTEFKAEKSQNPLNSTKSVVGYYLGKTAQQYTQYSTECTYTYENGASVKVAKTVNGENTTTNHTISEGTIDINQYILYSRTLDKGPNGFQDTPSVQVFEPLTATTATASFAISKSHNSLLNIDGELTPSKTDIVVGYINQTALYYISNVCYDSEQKVDVKGTANGLISKFTVVKIQNGYYSMQLASYDQTIKDYITVDIASAE